MPTHEFSLYVQVTDPNALIKAAIARGIEEGSVESARDYLENYGRDTATAIRFLADPGSLPGCKVLDSACE